MATGLQFGHSIEGLNQVADFVGGMHFHAVIQAPGGFPEALGQGRAGPCNESERNKASHAVPNRTSTVSSRRRLMYVRRTVA